MLTIVLTLAFTSAVVPAPHRFNQPLEREISLANLLDGKKQFTRADLDYYTSIFDDYKGGRNFYFPLRVEIIQKITGGP